VTDQALLERVERMESLYAIDKLADRYAIAADSRDLEGILDMFIPDVDCGRFGKGRDALRDSYNIIHRGFYRTIHQVVGHTVDLIDADHATGKTVMRAEHEMGDRWVVVCMVLFDTYERRDGTWYYVRRKPERWYSADILERPSGPDWGETGDRKVRLPHLFPTWEKFWDGDDENVARLTANP
jgi:hypothetical protein